MHVPTLLALATSASQWPVQRHHAPAWLGRFAVATHVALTGIMAWLSIALALPGDTFGTPQWSGFARVGTEQGWAYAFLLAAFFGAMGLITDRRWVQLVSVFILSTSHLTVAGCFLRATQAGGAVSTGTGTYAIIALLGFYLCAWRFLER